MVTKDKPYYFYDDSQDDFVNFSFLQVNCD